MNLFTKQKQNHRQRRNLWGLAERVGRRVVREFETDKYTLECCAKGRDQDHPQEKEMQKRQNGCLRRPY